MLMALTSTHNNNQQQKRINRNNKVKRFVARMQSTHSEWIFIFMIILCIVVISGSVITCNWSLCQYQSFIKQYVITIILFCNVVWLFFLGIRYVGNNIFMALLLSRRLFQLLADAIASFLCPSFPSSSEVYNVWQYFLHSQQMKSKNEQWTKRHTHTHNKHWAVCHNKIEIENLDRNLSTQRIGLFSSKL